MMRRLQRPSLLAIVLLMTGLGFFIFLAQWQLHRAVEKQQLLDSYAAAATAPAQAFQPVADVPDPLQFPHVLVTGHFEVERGYLLDAQVHAGRVGRDVIAVFVPDIGAQRLLVNRGWVENRSDGQTPPLPPLPSAAVGLQGLYMPAPGGGLRIGGDALATQTQWPKLTLYLDLPAIARDLGVPVYPRLLLQDAAPDSGFVREWTPAVMSPDRHRAYAFQWFAFALAALVIFVVVHLKKIQD